MGTSAGAVWIISTMPQDGPWWAYAVGILLGIIVCGGIEIAVRRNWF
jgi:hypothetical protein